MFEEMNTPDTRSEFERRLFLLREQVMNRRLLFPQGIRMSVLGLVDVRALPNGRLDLLSVNEFARLQANMTAQMEDRFTNLQNMAPELEAGKTDIDAKTTKKALITPKAKLTAIEKVKENLGKKTPK